MCKKLVKLVVYDYFCKKQEIIIFRPIHSSNFAFYLDSSALNISLLLFFKGKITKKLKEKKNVMDCITKFYFDFPHK